MTRGGSPSQTGIPAKHILGATDYQQHLGLGATLILDNAYAYNLPKAVLERASSTYRQRFSGNVVLIPRSSADVLFVERPIAFNSSFSVVHAGPGASSKVVFLQALAAYLNSDHARYFYSLWGRDWRVDERRIEANEIRAIPVPRILLDRNCAQRFVRLSPVGKESAIAEAFALPAGMQAAISEYAGFRAHFHNSQVPLDAFERPSGDQIQIYKQTITEEFTGGRDVPLSVSILPNEGDSIAALLVEHAAEPSRRGEAAVSAALSDLRSGWQDLFHDSGAPIYNQAGDTLVMLKPWFRAHWTVERAYVDSQRLVVEAMMATSRSERGSD